MLSNSVCYHTHDKQIGHPLGGCPILLSLVWFQTELDSTQSYYHYLLLTNSLEILSISAPQSRPDIPQNTDCILS